ncbi:hypothetical protein SDC9_95640 [bioreactor metagenome]|jgi:hypothetical protein|uniref:Uncharacterized protein n=1 Tax=bioreactor metagenome TaxID=1076179 RepID=A0A645ADI4_9ZZZZ
MFRDMRRFKQQLSEQECVDVLTHAPRGVLAYMEKTDTHMLFL